MKTLTLMLRLYELLAANSEEDLARAARAAGNETTMGRALRLLAEYRREHGEVGSSTAAEQAADFIFPQTRRPVAILPSTGKKRTKKPEGRELERRLRDVILSKHYFAKIPELVSHIHKAALPLKLTPKMGRARIYTKVKLELSKMDEEARSVAMSRLLLIVKDNETARWFDVIRKDP
jgi:hypothetical protein